MSSEVPYLLVPGLGLDERASARLRSFLTARVVRLPGMGEPAAVPDVDALAQRLAAGLGEGPVVLVGHSQSCQVVAAAAGDPRVAAVVLLGPTTDPRLRTACGLVGRWLATALREPLRIVPSVLAQWWTTGPRAMAGLWRRAAPDRIEDRLRAVRVPVVVVRGTRDRLCDGDWSRAVAASAPAGRLVEVAGGAHMLPMTHPAEVAGILRAVLA